MIESSRFTAVDISSEADTETLDRYGQNIDHYIENDYTYIPLPVDGKFYDREEGMIKELKEEQWIEEDANLIVVLEKLQGHPFLIIKRHQNSLFEVNWDDKPSETENESGTQEDENEDRTDEPDNLEDDYMISSISFSHSPEEMRQGSDDKFWSDHMTAEEFFNQHPEIANEELGSLYYIITLTDLNRRTVKQIAYPTIAELADSLSREISQKHPESKRLYPQLRPTTIGHWEKNKTEGLDIHISEYMSLPEMSQIIASSSDDFVDECGFSSKTECQEMLGSVNELRKKVMHANRTLVHEKDDIEKVLERIEKAQEIVTNLETPS